jgi:hypothetical protein
LLILKKNICGKHFVCDSFKKKVDNQLTDEQRRAQEKKIMEDAATAAAAKKEAAYLGIDTQKAEREKWAEEVLVIFSCVLPRTCVSILTTPLLQYLNRKVDEEGKTFWRDTSSEKEEITYTMPAILNAAPDDASSLANLKMKQAKDRLAAKKKGKSKR